MDIQEQFTPEQAEALYKEAAEVVAPKHTPAPPPQFYLKVTEERAKLITLRDARALRSGDMVAMADVLANFIWDGNGFVSYKDAQDLLDFLNMGQLNELGAAFEKKVELTAVPLPKEAESWQPSHTAPPPSPNGTLS